MDVHGRGFLGFSTVIAWEPARQAETVTHYDLETMQGALVPFAFLPKSVEQAVVMDAGPKVARLSRTETVYQVDDLHGGKTHFVHPASFTTLEWEEDVTVAADEQAERHIGAIDGADDHNALRVRHGSSSYDGFGNLLEDTVATAGGVERRAVSTYEVREDDWLIGLLQSRTTTSGDPSAFPTPAPRHTSYTYDDRGLLCHVYIEKDDPDPSIPEVLTYSRDHEGLVRAVTHSAVGVPARTSHVALDPEERVAVVQVWNDLGHSRWVLREPAYGVALAAEDENGARVQMRYDELGRPIEQVREGGDRAVIDYDPRPGEPGVVAGLSVHTTYDSGVESRADLDELERAIGGGHRGFDGSWIEQTTRYDLLGRVALRSRPDFGKPSIFGVSYAYDNLGRLTFEQRPGNATSVHTHTFFETHTVDPMLHESYMVRDLDGRTVKSVQIHEGKELATSYQYGDFDQLVRAIDPEGNKVVSAYDRRGRRWFSKDPDAGTATFTYNGFGEVTGKLLAGSAATAYTRDLLGRVTRIDDGDGTTRFTWDASPQGIGKLAHTESPDGITQDFGYDDLGRPVHQAWTVDGSTYAFDEGYDAFGRPSSLSYPAIPGKPALLVERHYNAFGYLDGVTDPDKELWHADARNADGALLHGKLGNGLTIDRTYQDDTGRLSSLTEGKALALSYDYDFDGAVQHRQDLVDQRFEAFDYDDLHRLTSWTISSVIPGPPGSPESMPELHHTGYGYDDLGNLTTIALDAGPAEQPAYGENGKPHALTHDKKGAYHYDSRGRQDQSPSRTVSYTERDLPRLITTEAGQTHFAYDASGQRVNKSGPDGTVLTLNGLYERREQDGKVVHVFRIEGGEGPVAESRYDASESSLVTEYLHRDAQGSLGAVSDAQGKVLRQLHYEPFGERRDKDGLPLAGPLGEGEIGYTGQRHDDDLGLIDMKGRIYDPALRRFLSPDPLVSFPLFGQSYNRYSYVLNDPVNLIDPSGLGPEDWGYSSPGCGTTMSCPDPIGFEMSIGGPVGDPSGGSSVADKPSGGPVHGTPPVEKRSVSLPVGASVPGGTRLGPQEQAWTSNPDAQRRFGRTLVIDNAISATLTPVGPLMSMYGAGQTGVAIGYALSQGDVGRAVELGARMLPVVGPALGVRDQYLTIQQDGATPEEKAEAAAHAVPLVVNTAVDAGMLAAGPALGKGSTGVASRIPATVEELMQMMNKRPGVNAEFAAGDELRYMEAIGAEGSHVLMEGGESQIRLRPDMATRWTALHEWLHRTLQKRNGGPMPGEDAFIENFLERHQKLLQIEKPEGTP
ncbi:MAG: RHS repeat-associated core domain-containing protein [Byssovorax sp.]